MIRRIAILTGGGDCPGINAVIRSVTKKAILQHGIEVIGIEDGYEGLIHNRYRRLHFEDVSGIITMGGTILGTSNRADPYKNPTLKGGKTVFEDVSKTAIANLKKMDVDCLVCVGGDGTLTIAYQLLKDGIPVVGVPKTIDNDLMGTDVTFGFDSAVAVATDGIDRLHTTAQSHHRAMIIEVMGRNAGWIALHSGAAGGGDIILIPEIPYDINLVAEKVKDRSRRGKRFTLVVISEGAKPMGGQVVVRRLVADGAEPVRLGGVGPVIADQIEKLTGIESRSVVLGHLQRGGIPTAYDRALATSFGAGAVDLIMANNFGTMIGLQKGSMVPVPLAQVAGAQRKIQPDDPLLLAARSVGACFGDV